MATLSMRRITFYLSIFLSVVTFRRETKSPLFRGEPFLLSDLFDQHCCGVIVGANVYNVHLQNFS